MPIRELSWSEIERDARCLAQHLAGRRDWAGILAVARGGLAPALLVAQQLDIRRIQAISVRSYDGRRAGEVEILDQPSLPENGLGWLVIDDLVDGGGTMRAIRARYPALTSAVLYAKPAGLAEADHHARLVPQEVWLAFPWEPPLPG